MFLGTHNLCIYYVQWIEKRKTLKVLENLWRPGKPPERSDKWTSVRGQRAVSTAAALSKVRNNQRLCSSTSLSEHQVKSFRRRNHSHINQEVPVRLLDVRPAMLRWLFTMVSYYLKNSSLYRPCQKNMTVFKQPMCDIHTESQHSPELTALSSPHSVALLISFMI